MVKKPTDGPCHRSASTVDGADNGVRTRDPHLGKVVLYQLSHVRVTNGYISRSETLMQDPISRCPRKKISEANDDPFRVLSKARARYRWSSANR